VTASSTPILDRLEPLPALTQVRRSGRGALIGACIAVIGAALWIALMLWLPGAWKFFTSITDPASKFLDNVSQGNSPVRIVLGLVCGPLSVLLPVIVIHELGHAVAGLIAGLRLVSIRFGPILFTSPFHFSITWSRGTGAAGMTLMVPAKTDHVRLRTLIMVAAGPAANLISAFAVLLLVSPLGAFLTCFVLMSVLIGLLNLVPFRNLSMLSDGKRILMLLRSGGQGERWLAILQLATDIRSGVAFENLRPDFMALAISIRDASPDTVTAHALAYTAAMYRNENDEAARSLEICLQYSYLASPALREALISDAGVFQARKRKRADLAEQWLAELPEKTEFPARRARIEAAILEAQGNLDDALAKLAEVETALQALPDPQQRQIALTSLHRWRSEIQTKQTAALAVAAP